MPLVVEVNTHATAQVPFSTILHLSLVGIGPAVHLIMQELE